MLTSAGYQVVAADCAVKAHMLWEESGGRFDMVVTDMVMPGESGRDLVRRLRRRSPGLRCLYVSGYDPAAGAGEAPDGPLLRKPIASDRLLEKVREVLDSSEDPSPRPPASV